MSEDQKNPPAQPEFGELAPEGWSWNPEANAPHTPETLKAAEAKAKAAAKAHAVHTAATAAAVKKGSQPTGSSTKTPKAPAVTPKTPKPTAVKPTAAKATAPIFVAPATPEQPISDESLSEDEKKTRAVAAAKLASDRFITWGLLGVAAFSVLTGLGDYLNLSKYLNAVFDQLNTVQPGLNLEPYSNLGLAKVLGWGIVMTQAIVIGLTFWWAIRRMRNGKMAFWVPVVGFAVASAVVFGFLIFALVSEPAAWNAILNYIQSTPIPSSSPSGQSS